MKLLHWTNRINVRKIGRLFPRIEGKRSFFDKFFHRETNPLPTLPREGSARRDGDTEHRKYLKK